MATDQEEIINKIYVQIIEENNMLHRENGLKLAQILDLEQSLFDVQIMVEEDGVPCWCAQIAAGMTDHAPFCTKARELTKHLWKKETTNEPEN